MTVGSGNTAFASLYPFLGVINEPTPVTFPKPVNGVIQYTALNVTQDGYVEPNIAEWETNTGERFTGVVGVSGDAAYNRTLMEELVINPGDDEYYTKRKFRLVGAGIKVRYTGTELQRGGSIVLWRNPTNNSVSFDTIPQLLVSHHATSAPVDRKWHSVTYRPTDTAFYDYDSLNAARTGGGIDELRGAAAPVLACRIAVTGAQPGASFEVHADLHYELLGANFTLSHTPADPVGLSAIASATRTVQNARQPEHEESNMARAMVAHVKNATTKTMSSAGSKIFSNVMQSAEDALVGMGTALLVL